MNFAPTPRDRLLIVAPHPDDESLACAGLIQRQLAAGGSVDVVVATDGDANPWPQRVAERRWRLGAGAPARWAARRRQEALAALELLGVPPGRVHFLHWPDQGLTRRMEALAADSVACLRSRLADIRPTLLAAPSLQDSHPDHSALALLVQAALHGMQPLPQVLAYWLHGRPPEAVDAFVALPLSVAEFERKRRAVLSHWSQTRFGKARLLSYAKASETFCDGAVPTAKPGAMWEWSFLRGSRLAAAGHHALRLVVQTTSGDLHAARVDLRPGRRPPGLVLRREDGGAIRVSMAPLWPDALWVRAKLDHAHRVYLYDTCAWQDAAGAGNRAPCAPATVAAGKDGESPRRYGATPVPLRSPDMRPWKILCDFDGTICTPDATDALLERLADPAWRALERDWHDGRIGSRECMAKQVALLDASDEDIASVLGGIQVDPDFPVFVARAQALGVELAVVSDGLDLAIRAILHRHGLDGLPLVANRLQRTSARRWRLDSPHAKPTCLAGSGTCKCAWAAGERDAGDVRILLIGDGQSDLCVSGRADFVFAKDRLLSHCRDSGLPHRGIAGFGDALSLLPELLAGRLDAAVPLPVSVQAEPA